jgi:hypothetical protein
VSRLLSKLGLEKALGTAKGVAGRVPEARGALGVARDATIGGPLRSVGVPGALLGGSFLMQLLAPAVKGMFEDKTKNVRFASEMNRELQYQTRLREIEHRRIETSMLRSMTRLAAANPQLYNEVMAGRKLPQGAVVLGGRPRMDLMEELALGMSAGQFPQEMNPDQEMEMLTRSSRSMGPRGTTETATFTRRPKRQTAAQTDEDFLAGLMAPAGAEQ